MTAEEFLKHDNSYLHHSLTAAFLGRNNKELREAYESGVKTGWKEGMKNLETSTKIPHNINLSYEDYHNIISLLSAFGYQFIYSLNPYIERIPSSNIHFGLNICKNLEAIKAGVVVSDEVKQKVFQLLKENSDPRLWNH